MNPPVSIGMPVYNGERFLEAALASILGQTFTDFELIVSDNASTDGTQDICRQLAKTDKRIRYFRNTENLGAARNYNRVFELATGRYFKWAAHDDVCLPEFLSRCMDVLAGDPSVVLCYPIARLIDEHGNVLKAVKAPSNGCAKEPHVRFHEVLTAPECNAVFGLIRSGAIGTNTPIGGYMGSDQVLLAELSLKGRFYVVPESLFCRRYHPEMSLRANRSYAAVAAWFDPARRGSIVLPSWRLCFEYARALAQVGLGPIDKLLCYWAIVRWTKFMRMAMARQLYHAVRAALRRELSTA
jgi:glycosyltransferase involved in cell wall biosynthesis